MYARDVSDVEVLRSVFAGWERGDFSGGVTLYADDMYFTTVEPEGQYDGHGPAGVRRWMQRCLGVLLSEGRRDRGPGRRALPRRGRAVRPGQGERDRDQVPGACRG